MFFFYCGTLTIGLFPCLHIKDQWFLKQSQTKSPNRQFRTLATELYVVTIHHKMSRKAPDFQVHLFKLSECAFDAINIGETHFQIRALMAELATIFDCGGTTLGSLRKTCFKC